MYNAYARPRPYSPPSPFNGSRMSPIEAQPPMDEMRMGVMGGGEEYWRNRGGYGQFGGPGPVGQVMPGQMAQATTLGPESLRGGHGGLMSGLPGQKPEPLMQFDPRINLSPNAFGPPPEPVSGWMNTPSGRLWSA